MNRRAALCLFAFAALGCHRKVAGSGKPATDSRTPGPFAELDLNGAFDVRIELGRERHGVAVDADDNLLPFLVTETNGRRLRIAWQGDVAPTSRPRVSVSAPDLVLVRCSGDVDVRVTDVRNARFQIDLNGGGRAEATGSTQKLKVFIVGSGVARLEALAIDEALVHVSGSGQAEIGAPKHLEVELHGTASVSYAGDPVLESTVRDAGTLRKRP